MTLEFVFPPIKPEKLDGAATQVVKNRPSHQCSFLRYPLWKSGFQALVSPHSISLRASIPYLGQNISQTIRHALWKNIHNPAGCNDKTEKKIPLNPAPDQFYLFPDGTYVFFKKCTHKTQENVKSRAETQAFYCLEIVMRSHISRKNASCSMTSCSTIRARRPETRPANLTISFSVVIIQSARWAMSWIRGIILWG